MKILYLQCNMGAAGDMLTASLASLLPDPNVYLDTINGTGLDGVKTTLVRSASKGMAGLHAHVVINGVEEETRRFITLKRITTIITITAIRRLLMCCRLLISCVFRRTYGRTPLRSIRGLLRQKPRLTVPRREKFTFTKSV